MMDLSMPVMNGFEACEKIKTYFEQSTFFIYNESENEGDYSRKQL